MIYRHYRTESNGGVTVAYNSENGLAELAVSWCSPQDPFSRVKGRLIAKGRLDAKRGNGHYHSIPHVEEEPIRETIFAMLGELKKKPRWYDGFMSALERQWEESKGE